MRIWITIQIHLLFERAEGIGQHWAVTGGAHDQGDRVSSRYLDGLLPRVKIDPFAVDFILVWVIRIEALNIQIHHIRPNVGEPPGNPIVVADNDTRHARKRKSADLKGTGITFRRAVQVVLEPDGRHLDAQMGVIGQQGHAGRGVLPSDRP